MEDIDPCELIGNLPVELWLLICDYIPNEDDRIALAKVSNGMRKLIRYTKPWTCYTSRWYSANDVEKSLFLMMDDRTSMVIKKGIHFFTSCPIICNHI